MYLYLYVFEFLFLYVVSQDVKWWNYDLFQVKEITTVSRTAVTASGTNYPALAVTAADTTIPNFGDTTTTAATNAGAGESLLVMNRAFIKSLEDISDPSCS